MKTQLDDALDAVLGTTPAPRPTPSAPRPLAASVTGYLEVLVTDLHASENNPRERLTGIDELASSIAEQGLIQPIIAQRRPEGTLQVVAGHRRLEAVKRLGWFRVEAIVRKEMRADAELAAMLVENGQRADLDPIEEARALQRLKAQLGNVSDADVAKKVGRSYGHVINRIKLLALPIEQQEEIRAGRMSLTEGNDRARIASGRIRTGAIGRPASGHLSASHALSERARARCLRLKHSRGKGVGVGGVACGECWESVIRADERTHLHEHSARTGTCGVCGGSYAEAATDE